MPSFCSVYSNQTPFSSPNLVAKGSSKPFWTHISCIPAAIELVTSTAQFILSSHSVLLSFVEIQIVTFNICF